MIKLLFLSLISFSNELKFGATGYNDESYKVYLNAVNDLPRGFFFDFYTEYQNNTNVYLKPSIGYKIDNSLDLRLLKENNTLFPKERTGINVEYRITY